MDINSIVSQRPKNEGDPPPLPPPPPPPPPSTQPRKRRRPALSCIQCRRRKIKCDRNMPCGQCISSKTSACQYSSDPAPQSKRPRGVNDQYPVTPSSLGQYSPDNTTHVSPNYNNNIADNVTNGIPLVSTNFWAERTPLVEAPVPARGQAVLPRQKSTDPSVQALLDRVHKLEQVISDSETLNGGPTLISGSYVRGPSLRGSLSKTRFFGQSHWMNSFEQVC